MSALADPTLIADRERTAVPRPDYARRVDELGKIIERYNEITNKLQKSHDQLTGTVVALRKELSEKNRQLERRNRLAALGEMAAGMAHEIRNPLGGIQLYASLLAKDVADRRGSLELVTKISGGVRRLEALVSQVLQFTKEIKAVPRQADLGQIVAQAVEDAQRTFDERGVCCDVQGPSSLCVRVDPLLMEHAVLNLLLNAAEAIGPGGTVSVCVEPADGAHDVKQFRLVVTDSGLGIPPEILDRIFNPFFTTKDNGTGLGLSIVHRIVEAHDGTITAANQEGGGARFEIRV